MPKGTYRLTPNEDRPSAPNGLTAHTVGKMFKVMVANGEKPVPPPITKPDATKVGRYFVKNPKPSRHIARFNKKLNRSRGEPVESAGTFVPVPRGSEPYVKYKIPRTEARLRIKAIRKQMKRKAK